jgi:hypothetical protein
MSSRHIALLALALVALGSLVLAAGQSGADVKTAPPTGTMNEVMRSVLFPNANLIFDVQLEDPSVNKPGPKVTAEEGGYAAWGMGLYPRWDVVAYAAVALEESAALVNRTDRLCENGNAVPAGRADWIKFTTELTETAKAIHAAARAKNRDAVIELVDRLNDACNACHRVYRRNGAVRCVVPQPQ